MIYKKIIFKKVILNKGRILKNMVFRVKKKILKYSSVQFN
jgi:hypothetical protein